MKMCVSFPVRGLHDLVHQKTPYKALEAAKALSCILTWTQSKHCCSACCNKVGYNVGTKTLSGLWFDPDNTSGPELDTRSGLLDLFIYNGSQSRNSHQIHTSEPCLASWFLAMKSEEGNKATFSHWPI